MTGTRAAHWNAVFESRAEEALTWFEAVPELSLEVIARYAGPGDAIIDVGGGQARLVDALLARGFGPVSVLDVSEAGLAVSRDRLGERASDVAWICADITRWIPSSTFRVWHDRAVFHFLTERADRQAYAAAMVAAIAPGGIAIIATFADDGPEKCSGLPVARYSPEQLAAEIEDLAPGAFRPVEARRHTHVTPKGTVQNFQVSVLRRSGHG